MNINTDLNSLKMTDGNNELDKKKLMQTCQQLEGEFLKIMFKTMKSTIPESDEELSKSSGRNVFEDLMIESIVEDYSKNSSLGLAKQMYDQFTKTYEYENESKSAKKENIESLNESASEND